MLKLMSAVEYYRVINDFFFPFSRYKGTYCSQDVAIKILKTERLNTELQKEFAQEVYIMRFVRVYLRLNL